MGVTAAVVGGAVIGAAGTYFASQDAADAQSDAADTQAAATTAAAKDANATQLYMFEEGRKDTAPWREAGANALKTLINKVNAGPGEYTSSPGYTFRVGEGQKAIERSAAARGGLFSGRTGKELTRFGQDYATQDYQNFLANYYNSLTPFQSLAQVGQTTASQNAVLGNQAGANMGQNTMNAGISAGNAAMNAGNAEAAGYINQANALTGGLNSGVNNYLTWKYIQGRNQTPSVPVTSYPAYTPSPGYAGLDYGN
jgi:hypothetical protein